MSKLLIPLVYFLSFSALADLKRIPSSIISELEHIERAINPFEALRVLPGTPLQEIDKITFSLIEKVTGWDLFTINKYIYEQRFTADLQELTIKETNSLKKIIDSRLIISEMYQRKKLRFKIFGKEFSLGAHELETIAIKDLRDIQIYLTNKYGHFHIRWTDGQNLPSKILGIDIPLTNNSGYLMSFKGIGANESDQIKIESLEIEREKLKAQIKLDFPDGKVPLAKNMKVYYLSNKIGELKMFKGTDPQVIQTFNELKNELDLRYQIAEAKVEPATGSTLKNLYSKLDILLCEGVFLNNK
jgi:hypothetical protein